MNMINFKNAKVVEFYGYRNKVGQNIIMRICNNHLNDVVNSASEVMWSDLEKFLQKNGRKMDNHIVFKINTCPFYFWVSDNSLMICGSIGEGVI